MDLIFLIVRIALALVAAVTVIFVILSLIGWEKVWSRLAGSADLGPVDFEGLKKRRRPNQALICPAGLCDTASVDADSPIYRIPAERLSEEVLKVALREPNIERVDDGGDPLRLRFVQRSPRLRCPDTINVEAIPRGGNTSTLAYYARAQIGKTDFGVNLKRGKRWLRRMKEFEKQT